MFKKLKDIGVELSLYHGGLLNGKDIKKVMNNATYFFDGLSVIIKAGNRPGSNLWMLKHCACSLERCLFYGMGHFC